jgi:AraC family transcriptional regulator of arabinose operon
MEASMSYSIYPMNPLVCNLPVLVQGIGYEDHQPHVLRREGFAYPQIFICTDGEGILKVCDVVHIIKKGYFFFLTSNLPHEYYASSDKWELEWIVFTGNQIDRILSELNFGKYQVGILDNVNRAKTLYHKIFISLKSEDKPGKIIASSALYELLTELSTLLYRQENVAVTEANVILTQVKQYIEEHYTQNITLEELSALVHITPQYLCRLFKKHLHLRPMQYITMKRIQYAKKLLSNHRLSVNEIAHIVGFNDCSYFSAIFKKYEMISPTEFRGL